MNRTRWVLAALGVVALAAACAGTGSAAGSPGFRASPASIDLTSELQPSKVTGGKSVPASSIPVCPPSDIVEAVSVAQKRFSATAVQVVFTTTLRRSGPTPCGIGEFQTCTLPGWIALASAHGRTIWKWAPPQLMRRCDPAFLTELPLSISSPRITFTDNLLPAGAYVVTTRSDPPASTAFRLR